MPNFDPILQTGKFLSSVVILIFIFAIFNQHFRSPLDYSLIILYGYFVIIQITTAVTLLLYYVREVSKIHVNLIYFTLTISTFTGLLLMILFSASLVRIINCCVYPISGFQDITNDLTFNCPDLKCDENIIQIALPTLIFALCSLWSHQQIYNVNQYLLERKRELEEYNDILHAPTVAVGPHTFSDPYDLEVSSVRSSQMGTTR